MNQFLVTAFYKFFNQSPETVEANRHILFEKGEQLNIKGLLIIGTEGVNSTICGQKEDIIKFKNFIMELVQQPEIKFKDSWSDEMSFKRWKVKIRKEIVTIGHPGMVPKTTTNHHLSPKEWNQAIKNDDDVVVVDTRNFYETKIGKFKTAIDPDIEDFKHFTDFMQKSNIEKDKKVLIYCTGGIRCEKAIIDLNDNGYENVFQLEGGILNYIKEFPHDEFEGECFVFDHRVGVDQELKPSQNYTLCPHCGNPAEQLISCNHCHSEQIVCSSCLEQDGEDPSIKTCSKNCRHHYKMGHRLKTAPKNVKLKDRNRIDN